MNLVYLCLYDTNLILHCGYVGANVDDLRAVRAYVSGNDSDVLLYYLDLVNDLGNDLGKVVVDVCDLRCDVVQLVTQVSNILGVGDNTSDGSRKKRDDWDDRNNVVVE